MEELIKKQDDPSDMESMEIVDAMTCRMCKINLVSRLSASGHSSYRVNRLIYDT